MSKAQSTDHPHLPTVAEIKERRRPRVNANEEHEESLSAMERVAVWITNNIGTMGFFLIIFFWTMVWMAWNYLADRVGWKSVVFDSPWSFAIWLFISNLIQIHLMPLIMLGQNLQSRHAELRSELVYQNTQTMEDENEAILRYLSVIYDHVQDIDARLKRLEAKAPGEE
jgi:uncharacterized membrane protein